MLICIVIYKDPAEFMIVLKAPIGYRINSAEAEHGFCFKKYLKGINFRRFCAQSVKICSVKNLKMTDPRKLIPFLNLLKMRIS